MAIIKKLILCLAAVFTFSLSQGAWAVSCFAGTGISAFKSKNLVQTGTITNEVTVPNGFITAGTTLWRSQTFSTAFTCFDTERQPDGESVYLYWDPQKKASTLHKSIEIGITINGVDYPLKGTNRLFIGAGTVLPANKKNCDDVEYFRPLCATPQTINVQYSIFVKATGVAPPADGKIPNPGIINLFQVDGSGGLNPNANSNFNLRVSGLDKIKFVECNPIVSIGGTNGNTVNFGRVSIQRNGVNAILNRKSFSVKADLSRSDRGGTCNGKVLLATFVATNPINSSTLRPTNRSDIGIQIFENGSNTPIQFLKQYEISTINAGIASTTFDAALVQLAPSPAVGPFNATAVVEVTFK